MTFEGKTVVIGVTSSIAAYKSITLVSDLKKLGINVIVIMTKNATELVTPLTFETISKNKVYIDTFNREFTFDVHHISLAKKADVFAICPATANIIAKMANGIADDMLSTTFLAMTCPMLVAPAMNTAMYENVATQANLRTLKSRGIKIIEPDSGFLACEDIGKGRLADIDVIKEHILNALYSKKDYSGKKVLITAGATCEALDPVRYITNHSSGKMGYALAKACAFRGGDVTLISGKTNLSCPLNVKKIDITSAEDMFNEVKNIKDDFDIIIKSAAVADYTPCSVSDEKIKKSSDGNLTLTLKPTKDILKYLGETKKEGQIICGFSMETQNMIENSRKKLEKKNCDMIVANNLKTQGAGFQCDTNVATLVLKDEEISLDIMSKDDLSHVILDKLITLIK